MLGDALQVSVRQSRSKVLHRAREPKTRLTGSVLMSAHGRRQCLLTTELATRQATRAKCQCPATNGPLRPANSVRHVPCSAATVRSTLVRNRAMAPPIVEGVARRPASSWTLNAMSSL
jgi:hypothetical protein